MPFYENLKDFKKNTALITEDGKNISYEKKKLHF